MIVTVHQAKTNLSKLLEKAEQGQEIIIARGTEPAARLVPVRKVKMADRKPGALKGSFRLGKAFFEPLSEEELATWE